MLRDRIGKSPPDLVAAFMAALTCTVRSCPEARLPASADPAKDLNKAHNLITALRSEHDLDQKILRVQILLLMAIEALNHGPYWKNGFLSMSHREWLSRAVALVDKYQLNRLGAGGRSVGSDLDASHCIVRRLYWIMFILDRWQGLRDGTRFMMEFEAAALDEDRTRIGQDTYELVTEMLDREQQQHQG